LVFDELFLQKKFSFLKIFSSKFSEVLSSFIFFDFFSKKIVLENDKKVTRKAKKKTVGAVEQILNNDLNRNI